LAQAERSQQHVIALRTAILPTKMNWLRVDQDDQTRKNSQEPFAMIQSGLSCMKAKD